jgi:hypothetical protein
MALATLASKMSALEETVPLCREGGFRVDFFLSFFAFIVSELGRGRTLALEFILLEAPRSPLTPSTTWGMELTVSVSTVMLLIDSEAGLLLVEARLVNDLLARLEAGGGGAGAVALDGASRFSALS